VRETVTDALSAAGLLLSQSRHERLRREAFGAGRRLLPHALAGEGAELMDEGVRSLGLAEQVAPRLLGFGWQQADALAALAGTPLSVRPEVAHLGALFNLGIVLFDVISDRYPERARLLLGRVTPEFLEAHLGGRSAAATASGDAAVDLLVALIGEFFARSRALGGGGSEQHVFSGLIRAMYGAQRYATATRRDQVGATPRMWRELRRKSALPMATMAHLALLAEADADATRRLAVRTSGRLAGNALWIIDDLADLHEDWHAGCWSRTLWLLARVTGELPPDADGALRRVIDSGIVAAEARRLAATLCRLRELADEYGQAFLRSVQATVHAWLEALPG
jgi:hypothetical protein